MFSMNQLIYIPHNIHSRSITAENPTGARGGGGKASSNLGAGRKGSPCLDNLAPVSETVLADISGPGAIRHIWITSLDYADVQYHVLKDLELLIYWDDEPIPSVHCPLGPFFCLGFEKYYEVHSLPMHVNPRRALNCYFTMPFQKRSRIVVRNLANAVVPKFFYQIDYTVGESWEDSVAYFHTYHQKTLAKDVIPGQDLEILPTISGEGSYIGTFLAVKAHQPYCWCEGEVKFFIDDDNLYPTICGTGTEDYFGGAWAFGVETNGDAREATFSCDYTGYPYHGNLNVNDVIHQRCLYRWHLTDPVYFHSNLRVTIQQMGKHENTLFERTDDMESVAYWYAKHT